MLKKLQYKAVSYFTCKNENTKIAKITQACCIHRQLALLLQRGRAMLPGCLVSFNSTIPRVQSVFCYWLLWLRTDRCTCNFMLFCCLRHNVEASCHKHFVVVFRKQQTNMPRSVCITFDDQTINSTRWSQTLVENRDFCQPDVQSRGSPMEYCHNVWYKKIERRGYLAVIKF